jgi:hypothetical protein
MCVLVSDLKQRSVFLESEMVHLKVENESLVLTIESQQEADSKLRSVVSISMPIRVFFLFWVVVLVSYSSIEPD